MDVVGSEIGQKMRSAIKAKLTELGCYVDDELPDYVMVMVANKRTRTQMEDDLQLFLVDNTKLFVNWLHQVLKKLQEVTVTAPIKLPETETAKEMLLLKDHKIKDKKNKDKSKKSDIKKSKKKDKDKQHRKRDERKVHKSKKKSKHHEMIHPNVPPLLMNMEKESEPSITDVFAGQILKRHGFILDETNDSPKIVEMKPVLNETKRPIHPIIDPATIPSQSEPISVEDNKNTTDNVEKAIAPTVEINREDQIKEMTVIEAKIQGLKQKLSQQLDSMSDDDEDFLNIRTEADELMNDFAEDVFQEISQPPPATPPIIPKSPIAPPARPVTPINTPDIVVQETIETLPQIELNLPKRPLRERLEEHSATAIAKDSGKTDKRTKSPERYTPERIPTYQPQAMSIKSRLGTHREKKNLTSDDKAPEKTELPSRKLNSRVSVLENRPSRSSCASVVRVRPRPRVQAPPSLLLKAMADAHKSLLNIPPKIDHESHVKRALVLPMRRTVDAQKIVIQVPVSNSSQADEHDADRQGDDSISLGEMDSDDDRSFKESSRPAKEEYIPASITKKITNNEYVPSRRNEGRKASKKDDTLIIETINIHNPTVDKDKSTQFIVTMDGYHPNAFLAKKLLNEGILNTEDELIQPEQTKDKEPTKEKVPEETNDTNKTVEKPSSNTSDESCTQVIIKKEVTTETVEQPEVVVKVEQITTPPVRKRKASPIVFDISKKERETERVKTESVSSDSHVTITTTPNTHKYDSVPPLSQQPERKATWCRAFPLCRYGSACAFLHPRCKFAAACTRRDCVYSHGNAPAIAVPPPLTPTPILASHVVPVANYKSISSVGIPGMCKYYPSCANPACHFYHPKPCRYGKNCTNKLECNFYHIDVPSKWKIPF